MLGYKLQIQVQTLPVKIPSKMFHLGQLRLSLVTFCELFLLGFQRWAWLPSDISEHFVLSWGSLWWSKPPCEDMSSNLFKDTTLLFLWNAVGSLFLSEGKQQVLQQDI